jgi:integrase
MVHEFLSSKARGSINGNIGYKTSLIYLHQFLSIKYSGMTLESIISSFNSKSIDVYRFLNEFVAFLETKNLSVSSMVQYMTSVKSYLQFHDIDIVPYKFKKRVIFPKIPNEEEFAIDQNDTRKILLQCHNHRLKIFLLFLASSGARAIEACALRIRDINFNDSPTGVHIRAEYTKTKKARDIYISDEASRYLKEYVEHRFGLDLNKTKRIDERLGDCLVFQVHTINTRKVKPRVIYNKLSQEFHKVLDNADLGQRRDGISKRRKISFHSFRSLVKTALSDADDSGSDYSEWFLGHKKSTYYKKKKEARAEKYAKSMKYLTYLDYSPLRAIGRNNEAKIKEIEKESQIKSQKYEEEMKAMNERMDRMDRILKLIEHNPMLARAKRSALERLANTK